MAKRHRFPNSEWKGNYLIRIQVSIIVILLLMIGLVKLDLRASSEQATMAQKQEIVMMEEVVQTQHEKIPPIPPRPQIPVEVPNDEVIEELALNLDSEINMDQKLRLPPPPAEDEPEREDAIFIIVETPPQLIGGLTGLQQKLMYPQMARQAGIEGRVYVQFIIDEKGRVQDPEVVRGIGGGCDQEALRVVSEARFTPGLQRGRPVKIQYSMPIVFQLDAS